MKNIRPIIKHAIFGSALTLLLTSCSMQDDMNKRFDSIDSNFTNLKQEVDENKNALNAQNELINKINEQLDKLNTAYEQQGNNIISIKETIESPKKSFEQVKNEQTGLLLGRYYESYARQPEASEMLNKAKDALMEGFSKISTTGKAYGLGSVGGANSSVAELYSGIACDGVFDCIARQPEISETSLSFEVYIIDKIENISNDLYCEMIGLSSTSVFDGMARASEIAEKLSDYGKYVADAIPNVKNEIDSISIGYTSASFFSSAARQPSVADDMWSVFKDFIDSLVL